MEAAPLVSLEAALVRDSYQPLLVVTALDISLQRHHNPTLMLRFQAVYPSPCITVPVMETLHP